MRRYVNNIDVSNVMLGLQAGASLSTGGGNLLVGPTAGSKLTTGNRTMILGGYDARDRPDASDTLFISKCDGTVCAEWDAAGNGYASIVPDDIANSGSRRPKKTFF